MTNQRADRNPPAAVHEFYLVKSLVHASEILWSFQHPVDAPLSDVMTRTGFGKGMCFRLLYTLRHCGFIEKVENNRYRLTAEIRRRKKYRIGYAAQGQDSSFAGEVHNGLVRAAERAQIELIVADNRYLPKVALKNAELLIREGVDLVIEFQTDEAVAPAIASAYHQAGIPMIAIDIPHPGATYFGANNYEAGLLAGRHLARWAKQHWTGGAEILLLELARAGSLPAARGRGVVAGIRDDRRGGRVAGRLDRCGRPIQDRPRAGPQTPPRDEIEPDPRRRRQRSERARRRPRVPGERTQRRLRHRRAQCRAGRPGGASAAAHAAHRVGRLFPGALRRRIDPARARILGRRPVAPAMFVKHQIVTRENVDHLYPNDALTGVQMYAGWAPPKHEERRRVARRGGREEEKRVYGFGTAAPDDRRLARSGSGQPTRR